MNRDRHSGILPADVLRDLHVTIVGVGSVGSFTAINLARMGVGRITAYDPDTVEDHNLAVQFYGPEDLGSLKVEALGRKAHQLCDDVVFFGVPGRYGSERLSEVAICCVDSMEARHYLWKRVKRMKPELYVDSRMGAEVTQIFEIRDGDGPGYERRRMFPSDQAVQLPCTEKATVYGAMGTATMICAAVRRYVTGEPSIPALTVDWVNGAMLREDE